MTRRIWVVVALVVGLAAGVLLQRQLVTVHCANAAEGYGKALVRVVVAWGDGDGDEVRRVTPMVQRATDERNRCQAGGLS